MNMNGPATNIQTIFPIQRTPMPLNTTLLSSSSSSSLHTIVASSSNIDVDLFTTQDDFLVERSSEGTDSADGRSSFNFHA